MAEWLVQLSGEKFDLEELPELFSSEDLKVIKDEGKYYLKSKVFNSFIDASKVKEQAKKFLKFINGAVKIYSSDFQPVSIEGIEKTEVDRPRTQYILPKSIKLRRKVSSNLPIGSLVMSAKQDKNIAKVLGFYSTEKNIWINLSKTLEVIEEDIGFKVYEKGWATKSKIKLFKHTANSYLSIGDEARHAHERRQPPKNPMEPSEAKSLIKNITLKWLREKANNLK